MPAHGSCTQSIWGWPSSSGAQALGIAGSPSTRGRSPRRAPRSWRRPPPLPRPASSRVPSGASAMAVEVGHGGILRAGWDRFDPLLDLVSNRACCAVSVAGALTPESLSSCSDAPMPEITLDLTLFATAFVTVLVIMDPIGNIPIFLSLTKGQDVPTRRRSALLASSVAGVVILAFALGGQQVLQLLGDLARGAPGRGRPAAAGDRTRAAPTRPGAARRPWPRATRTSRSCRLGTPLLAGPGAIAATMLYSRQAHDVGGTLSVVLAIAAVLTVIYLSMRYASLVRQGAPRQRHRAPLPGDGPPRRRHRRPARRPSHRGLDHERRRVVVVARLRRRRRTVKHESRQPQRQRKWACSGLELAAAQGAAREGPPRVAA